jgi:nucleoside-triphosphatase THEP1
MELAFESLPFIIAHLPEASAFIRKPMAVIQLLIRYAEAQFNTLKEPSYASVFIISGKVSEGKTRFITDLNRRLRDRQIATGGFYARRVMQDGQTLGYDLVRVDTGEAYNFLAVKRKETANHIGKYEINTDTLEIGKRTLAAENIQGKDVVFLDEIGRLELNGDGWSKSLEKLLAVTSLCLVITVRKDYLDQVLRKYNLHHAMIFHVSSESIVHAETMILNKILNQKPVHFR